MTVVTPSDRPKAVRNRCVIELFGDVFVLSCCPFDISVGTRDFVIGLSQISSFSRSISRESKVLALLYVYFLPRFPTFDRERESIFDKRDDFNFHITNFPLPSSNIPYLPLVFSSHSFYDMPGLHLR